MKQTWYFSHDFHARHDIKLQPLSMEKLGIFWCLVEMLYEENGYIKLCLCERIANALRTHINEVKSVIHDFELFENDGEKFWSNSVCRRLEKIKEKSEKASKSANFRWNGCERIAIKESKVNKINNLGDKSPCKTMEDPIYESLEDKAPKKYKGQSKAYARIATFYMALKGEQGNALKHYPRIKELWEIAGGNEELIKEKITLAEKYFKDKKLNWGLNAVITNWKQIKEKEYNPALYE